MYNLTAKRFSEMRNMKVMARSSWLQACHYKHHANWENKHNNVWQHYLCFIQRRVRYSYKYADGRRRHAAFSSILLEVRELKRHNKKIFHWPLSLHRHRSLTIRKALSRLMLPVSKKTSRMFIQYLPREPRCPFQGRYEPRDHPPCCEPVNNRTRISITAIVIIIIIILIFVCYNCSQNATTESNKLSCRTAVIQ